MDPLAVPKTLTTDSHHLPDVTSFDTVNNNDQRSSQLVVEHLVTQGIKRIAMLSFDVQNGTVLTEREIGYRTQMERSGLNDEAQIVRASQSLRDIQIAAKNLLESDERPEAIYCWTDFVALEVISVAESLELRVPGDIAIVGHDNTIYCDFQQNSLTSIDQGGEQIGLPPGGRVPSDGVARRSSIFSR
jgi:LacI family transcriptional regulator